MKKKQITLIAVASAVVLLVAAGLFIFTPLKNIFKGPISVSALNAAIQSGKLEIASDSDASSYFTFVSADEANKMLADAETAGQFKFLMPQFDIPTGGLKGVTIRNEDTLTDLGSVRFLSISGLPAGTTIYTNSTRPGQGGVVARDNGFGWYRTKDIKQDLETITYVPYSTVVAVDQKFLLSDIDAEFNDHPMDAPVFKLVTDLPLDSSVFPANTEIAYKISNGDDNSLADLKNVLMKDGKIVMIAR